MKLYENRKHNKLIPSPAPVMTKRQIDTFFNKKQEKSYTRQAILYGFDMIELNKRNLNDKIIAENYKMKKEIRQISKFLANPGAAEDGVKKKKRRRRPSNRVKSPAYKDSKQKWFTIKNSGLSAMTFDEDEKENEDPDQLVTNKVQL